jgi:hypothetical protein
MTDRQLHRAVARATGESPDTIARMGFQLQGSPDRLHDDGEDLGPNTLDWDDGSGSPALVREFFRAPAYA